MGKLHGTGVTFQIQVNNLYGLGCPAGIDDHGVVQQAALFENIHKAPHLFITAARHSW